MDAFGIFGFVIALVAFCVATLAYSQVAGLKAEVGRLRDDLRRGDTTAGESQDATLPT